MHKEHTAKSPSDAMPSFTRRAMLGGAAAAIGAPMVAAAGPITIDELAWRRDANAEAAAAELPIEERFKAAVMTLKAVLAEMHPEVDNIRHQYAPLNNGRSYSFWLAGHAPALGIWDGPGNYEVGDGKDLPAGVYFVDRVWCGMDRCWFFNAAFIFDGKLAGPHERIDPRQIIRKVERQVG